MTEAETVRLLTDIIVSAAILGLFTGLLLTGGKK